MKKITLLAMSFFAALFVNAQNGTDVTDQFVNADFEAGNSNGWTISGPTQVQNLQTQNTAAANGYQGTYFQEAWIGGQLNDFNWSQTQDMPNGVYVVKALAHAIKQGSDVIPVGVYVYAENQQTAVTSTSATEYTVLAEVTDGNLTIGYRGQGFVANWVGCDDFRIMQYLAATTGEAIALYAEDALAELSEYHFQSSLRDRMNASIASLRTAATWAAAEPLWNSFKALLADAELSIAAYEHLLNAINHAIEETEKGYDEGLSAFDAAINAATDYYDNATGDVAEVEAAIAKLATAQFDFQMANANGEIAFDVTEKYLKNPTMRTGSQGWEGATRPGLEFEVQEFYQSDFDIYQTLTGIPNGMYKVYVQGFYRKTWNDSGAAYQDGTEEISAELYANKASVPMLSIYKYTASGMGVTNDQVLNDYVNMRVSANEAFNLINPETDMPYYAENEVVVVVQDGTLKIGLRNEGHEAGSWCTFRDFKLYYYGNFPAVVLMINADNAQAWLDEHYDVLPESAVGELEDAIAEANDYTEPGEYAEDVVNEQIAKLEAVFAGVKNVLVLVEELKGLMQEAEEIMNFEYPGLNDLADAYSEAEQYAEEAAEVQLEEGQTTEEFYVNVVETFKAAIDAYYASQEATKDNPADYTYLIPNPNFEKKGNWTWSVVGGGTDQWNGGCRPNEDGGSNRQGVNLWGWGITSIDVHQELTNLPNGLYKVSAELITQAGYATDQHVYAIGVAKTTSKALEVEGWDTFEWEELTTTDYAVVLDGKLTIGAASSQGGSNSEGWFQATNFKLYYCGEATDADLEAAWEASLARAEEYEDVLLKGDSKALKEAIKAAESLADAGKYADACALLNPVVAASDSVYNVTQNFYNGNYQAFIDLAEMMDVDCVYSVQVYDAALELVDDSLSVSGATHKILGGLDAKMGGYVEYLTALIDAEYTLATLKNVKEEYINKMKDEVITAQVNELTRTLQAKDICLALLSDLQKAMKALNGATLLNLREGDLTEDLIENPGIDDADATGWIAVKGTGNGPTNAGEHYSGETSNRYLDSWSPNGDLNFTAYQEIFGLPDGTYELTVATRADGENVYAFAAPQPLEADTAAWTASTQWAMFKNYGAFRGEIWYNDSLAYEAADGVGEFPYYLARNSEGYGWSHNTITVEVTRHYLAIGITANSLLTGQAPFTGAWIGADDWKLVLVKKAATQSEFDPFAATGVENIEVAPVKVGIYDLFGRRIEVPASSGIYIVNGKKTVIKK